MLLCALTGTRSQHLARHETDQREFAEQVGLKLQNPGAEANVLNDREHSHVS